MERFHRAVPFTRQLYHRICRWSVWRRRFIGYDLDGNTYWEEKDESHSVRPRRMFEPRVESPFVHGYFDMAPVAWVQWLRHARVQPPTLEELAKDEQRVQMIQARAAFKQQEQLWNKQQAEQRIEQNLAEELQRTQQLKQPHSAQQQQQQQQEDAQADPWKEQQQKDQQEQEHTKTEIKPAQRG